MKRADLPVRDLSPNALDQLRSEAGEDLHRRRGDVVPVQSEEMRPASLASMDGALEHEAIQGCEDASLRSTPGQAGDVSSGKRSLRAGQYDQHVAFERRAYGALRFA